MAHNCSRMRQLALGIPKMVSESENGRRGTELRPSAKIFTQGVKTGRNGRRQRQTVNIRFKKSKGQYKSHHWASFCSKQLLSIYYATPETFSPPSTFDLTLLNQHLKMQANAFGFKCWQNKSVLKPTQMVHIINLT